MRQRSSRKASQTLDINSLSAYQIATLTEAASMLQLHSSALFDVVPKTPQKINIRQERHESFQHPRK
jgi:hypothetical protein